VAVAEQEVILSADDYGRIREVLDEKRRLSELYCTGCGYCMPCPNGVEIPRNFDLMNLHRIYGLTEAAKERYGRLVARKTSAGECLECGECEPKCPQHISIIDQLKEVVEVLG